MQTVDVKIIDPSTGQATDFIAFLDKLGYTIDQDQNCQQVLVLNDLPSFRTKGTDIYDKQNQANGTYYMFLSIDKYRYAGIQYLLSTVGGAEDITIKVYASNIVDPNLSSFTADEWVDVSTELLGAASITLASGSTSKDFLFWDQVNIIEWIAFEIVIANATTPSNSIKIWPKKSY